MIIRDNIDTHCRGGVRGNRELGCHRRRRERRVHMEGDEAGICYIWREKRQEYTIYTMPPQAYGIKGSPTPSGRGVVTPGKNIKIFFFFASCVSMLVYGGGHFDKGWQTLWGGWGGD